LISDADAAHKNTERCNMDRKEQREADFINKIRGILAITTVKINQSNCLYWLYLITATCFGPHWDHLQAVSLNTSHIIEIF
jgi:hypothetical protein